MVENDLPAEPMARLLAIMRRLRDPESGCPWDVAQSYETIAPYTIEEAYEVADAVSRGDRSDLRDELGDLLLQVVYFSQMAQEDGHFAFEDVVRGIGAKMVSRHPHVFGAGPERHSAQEQSLAWERQKEAERRERGTKGALGGVALSLPALMRAQKLQRRAARIGFDWPNRSGVLDKVREEAAELAEASEAMAPEAVEEEFGDLLFTLVNLARHLDLDAEEALRGANAKFERRFAAMEAHLARTHEPPGTTILEEMDRAWDSVKAADISD